MEEIYPPEKICIRKELKQDFWPWSNGGDVENKWKNHQDYSKRRNEITKLDLDNKNLTGSLNITDFINLEILNCSNNHLTSCIQKKLNPEACTKLILSNNHLFYFLNDYYQSNIEVLPPNYS